MNTLIKHRLATVINIQECPNTCDCSHEEGPQDPPTFIEMWFTFQIEEDPNKLQQMSV